MPTYAPTPQFTRDFKKLEQQAKQRFLSVVRNEFVPDLAAGRFRPGLRVKGVVSARGVFEMTWAPDGRATFEYGKERSPGDPHVIWRRIGTHAVFQQP
ncbi:hypothetical protein [Amycolatopsis sp. NPDC058986]|uniref:hypothetical protein n=1 Tax=Actinomycetes TaxID=1760 RepID=UPI003672A92C